MNETSDIQLNMDALNRNDSTYTSVTDLYNVNIFTNHNMQEFEARETEKSSELTSVSENVFVRSKENTTESVQKVLFSEEISISKKQEVSDTAAIKNNSISFLGGLGIIIFILVVVRYHIYRTIRRKKDADHDNFYQ